MSRRRGEFEHRTSIFEGAFRAWSHLGGVEPLDLESKATTDLDPLNFPIENDPRLVAQKGKKKKINDNDNNGGGGERHILTPTCASGADEVSGGVSSGEASLGGQDTKKENLREYPYEPLPRSGLAHPFVQAILSPWLGPDADQDAIQLGLTTLRTWWQHRRKGESGSAVVALGTEKMRGVVDGYTRHFFNLAHCLIVNDKEQPPRTLQTKMRELEKSRNGNKKGKKRVREDDTIKAAAMAFQHIQSNLGPKPQGGGADPVGGGLLKAAGGASKDNDTSNLSPLERLHLAQRRQLAESGGARSNMGGAGDNPLENMTGRCIPGKVDLPKLVQQVSSSVNQLAHRGLSSSGGMHNTSQLNNDDSSKYGDPNVTPVVVVSPNVNWGTKDIQFYMTIDGITCAHCVKIIETVLKGCNGSRSPIEGILDAAADMELRVALIKVENIADVRRVAHDVTRNLSMVGYTARARSVTVPDDLTLGDVYSIFENTIPNVNPMMGFNWDSDCRCPDNNVLRQDCPRHSQMSPGIIELFDKTEHLLTNLIQGCNKKTGMPCTTGIHSNDGGVIAAAPGQQQQQDQSPQTQINTNSMYPQDNNAAQIGNTNALTSYQQPIQGVAPAGSRGGDANKGGGPVGRRPRLSMSLNGRMSIGGLGGLNGLASITSETTFGRAMSGLSALSIDWENMEDFDVNLDHSAGINNDIINGRQQQGRSDSNPAGGESGRQVQGDGQDDAGGYGQQQLQADNMRRGPMVSRRSSLRKNLPVNPNGNMFNVSFNM